MGEFNQTIGFTLMGFFSYWNSSYQDTLWIRSLVAFLFIVNTTQAGAVVYMSWNFANPQVVATSLWPYPFTALSKINGRPCNTNQLFQSWRIYQFTRNKILVGFLVATSLAACGTGVAAAIESWIFSELAKLVALQPVVEANLALHSPFLNLLESKTSFANTHRVLNTLIRNAVQSGSFTAIFALGTLFSFRFAPETYMLALFALPIGRIYSHTMMDQLISREGLRKHPHERREDRHSPKYSTSIMLRTMSSGTKTHETLAGQSNSGTYGGESHQHKSVPVIG
ncbi:hypothetical protein B0H14DRAFT_2882522 [Mycena olivaceomarginata]|nr:hypothetical protein B0H14DRAFT_2882522 [Mycena olivaceomarginata]